MNTLTEQNIAEVIDILFGLHGWDGDEKLQGARQISNAKRSGYAHLLPEDLPPMAGSIPDDALRQIEEQVGLQTLIDAGIGSDFMGIRAKELTAIERDYWRK